MAESRRIPGGSPAERLPLPLGLAQTEILYPAAAGRGIATSVDGGVVPLAPERVHRGGRHGSSPRAQEAVPTSRHPATSPRRSVAVSSWKRRRMTLPSDSG